MTERNSGIIFKNKINKIIINFKNVSRSFGSNLTKIEGVMEYKTQYNNLTHPRHYRF